MEIYNHDEVEAEIEKIEEELEGLIVKEICDEYSFGRRCYYLSLDELHMQYFGLGFCHLVWEVKKRILDEKYGIKWKSPSELNPEIFYD